MPGLLVPVTAAGAAAADVNFDRLRQWLVDGAIPVIRVADVLHCRAVDLGISVRRAASELGLPIEIVVSLLGAGDLKPLPLRGDTRLNAADLGAYVRKLAPLPMTDELGEEVWPSVEEYHGTLTTDPHSIAAWGEGQAAAQRRSEAAAAQVETEFQQYLRDHFPHPIVTTDTNGLEEVDMNGWPTPEEIAVQRAAWHQRRRDAAEAERYARHSRGYV